MIKEAKGHVLSVRVTESDYAALEKIAGWNRESVQKTARKALEMLIEAHSGQLQGK
jgi:hypothetical protein